MSPLPDALRAALTSRTRSLSVSPDLLAGVERRARRMRRQKVTASVVGSALSVAALGLGGPTLVSSLTEGGSGSLDQATTAPRPEPAPVLPQTVTPQPPEFFALDPANPWPYRGVPIEELGDGTVETVRVEYAARRGVDLADVALSPLYGQVDELSAEVELFFVAQVEGTPAWGVARSSESGLEFPVDLPLDPSTLALPAALPGEAVSRLVVVASPEVVAIDYAPDGTTWLAMSEPARGVGLVALDGDPAADRLRVLGPAGERVFDGAAPDGESTVSEPEGPGTGVAPAIDTAPYALDLDEPWPFRGDPVVMETLRPESGRFVPARDLPSYGYQDVPLYAGRSGAGTSYLLTLHLSLDDGPPVITTVTQRRDGAVEGTAQAVGGQQLLVQSIVRDDGDPLLVALARPGDVVLMLQDGGVQRLSDVRGTGVGVWRLTDAEQRGTVRVHPDSDSAPYHSEPVRPG